MMHENIGTLNGLKWLRGTLEKIFTSQNAPGFYLLLLLVCNLNVCLFFFFQVHKACVSLPAYLKTGGTKLSLVQPGNYSVRVRATSLAGNGSFTETTYFFMPNRKTGVCISDLTELTCITVMNLQVYLLLTPLALTRVRRAIYL